jgi:hypothetical protein
VGGGRHLRGNGREDYGRRMFSATLAGSCVDRGSLAFARQQKGKEGNVR